MNKSLSENRRGLPMICVVFGANRGLTRFLGRFWDRLLRVLNKGFGIHDESVIDRQTIFLPTRFHEIRDELAGSVA
jgi:hypothetical protein